jgi:rRNA maturation RNase YbeY
LISFHFHDVPEIDLDQKRVSKWLLEVCKNESCLLHELTYVFCSDTYLLELNNQFLSHDYFTDILTFDMSKDEAGIHGEVYISVDRVTENAKVYQVKFQDELARVMVHGLLHLLGYDDHGDAVHAMRIKEDTYLSLLKS